MEENKRIYHISTESFGLIIRGDRLERDDDSILVWNNNEIVGQIDLRQYNIRFNFKGDKYDLHAYKLIKK